MSNATRVGFVGLGIMGRPMAGHLLQAGYRLWVNTRTPGAAADLLSAGATWAETPADVARASDVIVTMLPDTPDVEDVLVGEHGVLDGAHAGLVVVDMSTIDPMATRALHDRLKEHGIVSLDAPVSGGEKGAIEGTLSIMVGGPAHAFERIRPILETMGRTIVRVGEAGAGQVAKACNQLVVGANIQAVAEALSLARRAGVDPAAVREVLLGGFAASRVLEVHGQRMLDRAFEPGFRVRLHRKDARIIRTLAASAGSPTPEFDIVADAFDRLDEAGGGDLDHSALITLFDAGPDGDRVPALQPERSAMTTMLTLAGRYYRMHPPSGFLGFDTKRLDLPIDETAVLAVDIYGQHDRPDVWSGLVAEGGADRAAPILRDHIGPALDAARTAGLPVIYVANSAPRIALRHSAYGELKWDTVGVDQDDLYAETGVDPAEYHAGPSEVLKYGDVNGPKAGDYYVRKHVHSGFFDTRLDTLLRNLGIRNLVCVGFALDVCLGTTMIDAVWRNYRVVLLRDCTYAVELPGIDEPGTWTDRWITYVECNIGCTTTSADFIQACRAASDRPAAAEAGG